MSDGKSTNISEILDEEDNNDLVQEIINEIQNQQQTNMNLESNNEPVKTVTSEILNEVKEMNTNNSNNVLPTNSNRKNFASPIGVGVINPNIKKRKPNGFLDKLINFEKLKLTLLVIGIVFLLSLPILKSGILKLIPNLSNDGELNIIGIFLKSLSAGILFYVGNIFI